MAQAAPAGPIAPIVVVDTDILSMSEVRTVLERIRQADRLEVSLGVESEIFDED